jgi:C-terminal processing protease CtpA/Prc
MHHNYFWTDQLRDSTDYDYSLEPSVFFKSMLVPEDRFSYCEANEYYRPPVKGFDLNETVSFDSVYIVDQKRVGYFVYDEFASEADVTDVVQKFNSQGIDELIIDVRGNPGGYVETCRYLASLVVPKEHIGNLFCSYRYNRYLSQELYEETGSYFEYSYLREDFIIRNRNLNLSRVFFLVNGRSASCSELIINTLRPYMQTVVIGETTVGKDVGMRACSGQKYRYRLWPITFRTYNAAGDSVPVTGINPDIFVKSLSSIPKGDTSDPLLAKVFECVSDTPGVQ